MDKTDRKEQLIIDYLMGECSEEESDMLYDLMDKDKELRLKYNQYKELVFGSGVVEGDLFNLNKEELKNLSDKIVNKKPAHIHKINIWNRVAAAIVIITIISGITLYQTNRNNALFGKYTEYYLPNGSKSFLTLDDGTQVWLNAGSQLKYNGLYGKKDRKVFLNGEGYFTVAKDAKRPFKVITNDICVEALGTVFNVKAYSEDDIIETTLIEGKIKIENNPDAITHRLDKEVVLFPNQCMVIRKDSYSAKMIENKNVINKGSWKEDVWIISSETLSSLAQELERRYDITIDFSDEELKDITFTGKIKNEPVEQVLKAIELTAQVKVEIDGKNVRIIK